MTRKDRPSIVRCAGPCGQDVNARDARELVLSWPRPNSGKGTMTSPESPMRTGIYVCTACWRGRIEKQDDYPRELVILIEKVAVYGKQIVHFLIPVPDEMFPTERSSTA